MASEHLSGGAPYRDQHRPDRARQVRYDALRPETRARLAAAAHGRGAWCLRGEAGAPAAGAARRMLIAALALGVACLLSLDRGSLAAIDLADPQGQTMRLALAALLLQAIGLLVGLEVWAARKASGRPLERGVYLLARELVDARGHDLVLHDTGGLAGVRARGAHLELTFRDGARFRVGAIGLDPDTLRRELDERRAEALRAEADGDDERAARLDPLAAERSGWETSGGSGYRRLARLARLALGAVAVPAAMLLAALTVGRLVAIERAVARGQEGRLLWFAQTDRWMSGWAARRWADAALRSGNGSAQEDYLLYGPDPRGFARRLEARTGDCSRLTRPECAGTVKALCESRFHDPAALRRALSRLDLATTKDLGPRCQRLFDRQGWTLKELSGEQFARAAASRDLEVLWAFPPAEARPVIERLYDESRAVSTFRDTPTRRALDAALAHLRERDVDLVVGVTVSQASPADELARGTQALLHHLGRQPFGPLLRLATRARPRQEPREILLPDEDEGVVGGRPGSPGWSQRRSRHVWDEARLDVHLTVRTAPRREAEVTAVRWVLSTRERPALRNQPEDPWNRRADEPPWKPLDASPDEPWTTTTFEAPLDPPVRWSDATSLDEGRAGLVERLL